LDDWAEFANTFEQVRVHFTLGWASKSIDPNLVAIVVRQLEEPESARSDTVDQIPRLLYTVRDTAWLLSISRSKVYELIQSGRLRSVRIDGARRVPASAVDQYLDRLQSGVGK